MDLQFAKILKLIKLTGEKVVVFKDDQEFVVTNLDDYFRLIEGSNPITELSEGQMLDKINRDIALWRESQKELLSQVSPTDTGFTQAPPPGAGFTKIDDIFKGSEKSKPYYTPLRHSAQAEIDRLNDDIDNEMFSYKDSQDIDQKFSNNEPTLDEFKFDSDSSDFKEDYENINDNKDSFNINNIDFNDEEPWNDKNNINNDVNIEDTQAWGEVSDLNNEDDDAKTDYNDSENEDFTWKKELVNHKNENNENKEKPITSESKIKRPRVNNFGYLNPSDTLDDENNTQSTDKDKFNTANYTNIPPPPDIKNS